MRNGKLTQLVKIAVLICAFSASASAAVGLPEYRTKLQMAKGIFEFLLYYDESKTEADVRSTQSKNLALVRETLPPTETIELEGARFEADNNWLYTRLENFEAEADLKKRRGILTEIVERLEAIEQKLNELEKQEISRRAKDEDKQKLEEILNRAEYRKPEEKKETWLQKSWREFWEWLDRIFPKPAPTVENKSVSQPISFFLQLLVYALVLGVIGFLLYRFAPFLRQRFLSREKTVKKARVILGETLAADETAHNLFSEAERLAREGNLRAAIRKGYIALLCELSDRKIIGLANHKTNRDYLRDVRKRPELHQNMNALTSNFESVWYGFGKPEAEDWEKFREKYKQTVSGER
jgi:hypothetical protein